MQNLFTMILKRINNILIFWNITRKEMIKHAIVLFHFQNNMLRQRKDRWSLLFLIETSFWVISEISQDH